MSVSEELINNNLYMLEEGRRYIDQGFSVLLVEQLPDNSENDKKPLDLRPLDERISGSGYKANTQDPDVLRSWINQAMSMGKRVNLAFAINATQKIGVVDLDTAASRQQWVEMVGEEMFSVLTPGKIKMDSLGNEYWVHKNGAHVYVDLSSINYDGLQSSYSFGRGESDAENITLLLDRHSVMAPNSVRREGKYELYKGDELKVWPAPEELLNYLESVRRKPQKQRSVSTEEQDQAMISFALDPLNDWKILLSEIGWTEYGVDSCGCRVFTRPGAPGSPRSATAHDIGCTLEIYQDWAVPPLHIWTTENASLGWSIDMNTSENSSLRNRETITKIRLFAEIYCDGDLRTAYIEAGLDGV
ncbi:bifunctional DNA primase/polymerase [Corynebacterium kefirresidentii]|uniref:bifunctional DNA primase/polymerase n=1 Tax=Corynebacterium TaxID=1716 RepID=UPI0003B8DA37|nr:MULTISPECIES: bifunctional DNA primase/polymerase [unclassified Corynebacterium]ERS78427.1 hypothetical protein HMPREF1285_01665 [Corynebacterium sp. KPL1859]MDU7565072.1 bifunctional DNA primase/polymerase [Corynebacterium sp.]